MSIAFEAASFRRVLLRWYRKHRRDLPWRRVRDPYCTWVSEVMLQQTRVAVVQERYPDFLRRFPTIRKLASAQLAAVLAAWSGLGYYRRARALRRAARIVVSEHQGTLPQQPEVLRALPGIGRYTAAAIASIAFQQPVAVVDGNVERVLARLSGNAQHDCWERASELLDRSQPGDFNQAMMELGATVCLPHRPLCGQCPVRKFCVAQGKLAPTLRSARQKQQVSYALLRKRNSILLVQRGAEASLMPEMWELPQLRRAPKREPLITLRHSITNTDYQVNIFASEAEGNYKRARWVRLKSIERLPLTGLTRKILRFFIAK